MDPAQPKPPPTDLPDLFSDSGSSVPTVQRNATAHVEGNTLPSAHVTTAKSRSERPAETRRGHSGEQQIVNVGQVTMPSGVLAQQFLPSPAMVALGGELADWSPPRLVRVRYPAHEGWYTSSGSLSSGFVVAMFEPVYGAIAYAVAPTRQSAVIETSVRFFRAIRGGHVFVDGTLVRAGRTTATIECVAWDNGGELCAKGSATLMLVG
jgi:uncharacterized protein (TIGR00369 family)